MCSIVSSFKICIRFINLILYIITDFMNINAYYIYKSTSHSVHKYYFDCVVRYFNGVIVGKATDNRFISS